MKITPASWTAVLLLTAGPCVAVAQGSGALNRYGNPAAVKPAPTTPAITVRDLQIRLYEFSDDSMQGRQVGRVGNMKATTYIANEVKRMGLTPAGDSGTFFQVLPYHVRKYTNHSRLTIDENPVAWEQDWVPVPGLRAPRPIIDAPVIFGGVEGDTTHEVSGAQAAGKFVVLLGAPPTPPGMAGAGRGGRGGGRGGFGAVTPARFEDAAAIAIVDLDTLTPAKRAAINNPVTAQLSPSAGVARGRGAGAGARGRGGAAQPAPVDPFAMLKQEIAAATPPATIRLTHAAAARFFGGRAVDGLTLGEVGGSVNAMLDFIELPTDWGRNVVAIIPGSDPVLRNEYVAVGAHNDHIGFTLPPVDHDSLKAFNDARNKLLIERQMIAVRPESLPLLIHVNMDSVRRLFPKVRLDSIDNGADDDGSGSTAVLEIAEAIQSMRVKPKRSILFVWHTGEEAGLIGSNVFTHNPTVPMDSVVAQINMDMIGRGRAEDLPGGGPDYLAVVGSYFDSKDLGDEVTAVNNKRSKPFKLDYRFDSTLTWSGYNNIYGRSDHYNYALQGVPIAFFTTGLHGDYHQRTDEAEYIDYPHYAAITNYLRDLVVTVADGPRPRMNGSRPAKPPRAATP